MNDITTTDRTKLTVESLHRILMYCVKYDQQYLPGRERTGYAPFNKSGIPSVAGSKLSKTELRAYCDKHHIEFFAGESVSELHQTIEREIFHRQPFEWLCQQYEYIRAFGDNTLDMPELDKAWDPDRISDLIQFWQNR